MSRMLSKKTAPAPRPSADSDNDEEGRQVVAHAADTLVTSKAENNCQWESNDNILLLKEMIRYTKQNGSRCKLSVPYLSNFCTSLSGSSISSNYTNYQVRNKFKGLRKKYKCLSRKKGSLSPIEKKIVNFGGQVWGAVKTREEEEMDKDEDNVNDADVDSEEDNDPEILLWKNAMQKHCGKMFAWPGMYTMSKINNWQRFKRVSMAKEWLKEKREVDLSIFKLSAIEEDCINVMQD